MKEYIEKSKVEGMLWAVIMSKDERTIEEMLEYALTVQAIPIPKNATNEDMIEAIFPNCEQKEHMNNGYFEMYFDNDLENASYMRISKDWWRAPYKKEVEEWTD